MITRALLLLAVHLSLVTAKDCKEGYRPTDDEENCIDVDECQDSDQGPLCGSNAVCFNTNGSFHCGCQTGYATIPPMDTFDATSAKTCTDINECLKNKGTLCAPHATCHNAIPGYSCVCEEGFLSSSGRESLGNNDTCNDIDECVEEVNCGQNASCKNTLGSYYCECNTGFALRSGQKQFTLDKMEICEDICVIHKTICGNGTCHQGQHGHVCACHAGFSNYGNESSRCNEFNCDVFKNVTHLEKVQPDLQRVISRLETSCLTPSKINGEEFVEWLLSNIDKVQDDGAIYNNREVSTLLSVVEAALGLIMPFMSHGKHQVSTNHTELVMLLQRSGVPRGPAELLTKHAKLQIQWETAAGKDSTYPGYPAVSLLTYASLEKSTNTAFSGLLGQGQSLQMNSKVVTVKVSNPDTDVLQEPVNITFYHLEELNKGNRPVCVYWDSLADGGSWSTKGCRVFESRANYTVCSCNHLSSFAILMALHDIVDPFEMQVFTKVGLTLSLVCLFICILTFALIRSIQSPRNSIHLQLCMSLFIANLVFLFGISSTENPIGCAVVAGLLHFFYLAAFCWMCLEGIQLFRMVVMVFNTNLPIVRAAAVGYGVPAVIVGISAISNPGAYGTEKHCWLNWEGGFAWSFFGPVCFIIAVNIFFFIITVWKLALKFSSLNPDLDNLHKIKTFTITAVAQLCVLGITWIFGGFQFGKGQIAMSYLFTILNSLQGVLLFVMHCLLFKPVREEYGKFFSRISTPQKYSEFSSSQSSRTQSQNKGVTKTGESCI